jgi:hypothetical protein
LDRRTRLTPQKFLTKEQHTRLDEKSYLLPDANQELKLLAHKDHLKQLEHVKARRERVKPFFFMVLIIAVLVPLLFVIFVRIYGAGRTLSGRMSCMG